MRRRCSAESSADSLCCPARAVYRPPHRALGRWGSSSSPNLHPRSVRQFLSDDFGRYPVFLSPGLEGWDLGNPDTTNTSLRASRLRVSSSKRSSSALRTMTPSIWRASSPGAHRLSSSVLSRTFVVIVHRESVAGGGLGRLPTRRNGTQSPPSRSLLARFFVLYHVAYPQLRAHAKGHRRSTSLRRDATCHPLSICPTERT